MILLCSVVLQTASVVRLYYYYNYYEGHSKSYLPDHLTITLAFCFWHSIIDYIKYKTAAEFQLAQYLVTGHVTLLFDVDFQVTLTFKQM